MAMTTAPIPDGPSRRSWRDASRQAAAGDAGPRLGKLIHKSAISAGNKGSPAGGRAKQAVKTTACGTPDDVGVPVVTYSCAFHFAHEAADAPAHPVFRAPSSSEGGNAHRTPRAHSRRGIAKLCLLFDN